MGEVFEALHVGTGRKVAVKVVAGRHDSSPDAIQRFKQEGRMASQVVHPRCVFVLAADDEGGRPYIVMELMPGDTLADLVKRQGPLEASEAVARILDVADGLSEAHRLGLIHRDVKPSNCFLEADGQVKVGDFGLSKSLSAAAGLTRTGEFLGTPLFASPEQIKKEPLDPRADVYSAAATLYFLLTGRAPFDDGSGDALGAMARILTEDPPPPSRLRPGIPRLLDQVVLRGLARDRSRRWQTMEDFHAALSRFLPARLSYAGVGLRFAAYVIDVGITLLVFGPALLLMLGVENAASQTSQLIALVVFDLLYFVVPEGKWGCSLGKWLMRLRVGGTAGLEPPGMGRALVRYLVYFVLYEGSNVMQFALLGAKVVTPALLPPMWLIGLMAWQFVGLALLLCTMRARNGFRGLHEFVSGTRLYVLPARARPRAFPTASLLDRTPSGEKPRPLGSYLIRGTLWMGQGESVSLAHDPELDRLVVVREHRDAPLSDARRGLVRPARLRVLETGVSGEQHWDAFLVPSGSSLPDLVSQTGPLSWDAARPILEGLALELTAAAADNTLPDRLGTSQVWIRAAGQPVLLEFPLQDERPHSSGTAGQADASMRPFFARAVVLALEGQPRTTGDGPPFIRAPIPLHAQSMLSPLLRPSDQPNELSDILEGFHRTRGEPTQVSRARRLVQLAIAALFLFFPLEIAFLCSSNLGMLLATAEFTEARRRSEVAEERLAVVVQEEQALVARLGPQADPALVEKCKADQQLSRDLANFNAESKYLETLWRAGRGPLHEVLGMFVEPPPFLSARVQTTEGNRPGHIHWEGEVYDFTDELDPWMVLADPDRPIEREGTLYRDLGNVTLVTLPDGTRLAWRTGRAIARLRLEDSRSLITPDLAFAAARLTALTTGAIGFLLAGWAFLSRGGLSYRWARIALVRFDGRPARRLQCLLRSLLVWAPFVVLVTVSAAVEVLYWSSVTLQSSSDWLLWTARFLWFCGIAWPPLQTVLAVWRPSQTQLDRACRLHLVPR
jgi:hypothetical protein